MTKTVIHFHDLATEQGYIERNPTFVAAVELGGVQTFLAVPMLKENELIGVVIVYRQEVRPFSDKQVEIVKNFAAQAVIAIENARLLNELRQRTDDLSQRTTDLTEALEQQTATSDVLQVISRSPGDLEPVFASMVEKAVRICDATFGNIYRWDGEFLNLSQPTICRPPSRRHDVRRVVPIRKCLPVACCQPKRQFTSSTLRRTRATSSSEFQKSLQPSNLAACGHFWPSRCSRTTN